MSRFNAPLRYPGGKQKLAPFISEILSANNLEGGHYAEPFAGGAGVAIELLLSGLVSHVHLNDSCYGVYSFWKSVLCYPEEFCQRISKASLTVEEWKRQKAIFTDRNNQDILDVGFSLFYLNRCNRSGILSGGIIGGLKQKGKWKMDARFPRSELIRRVQVIAKKRKAIHLRNWDAERYIQEYIPRLPLESLVYFDPPYFKKADRLYMNHYKPEDHSRIAALIQSEVKRPWVVSYDGAYEIMKSYSGCRSFLYQLQYSAASAYKGTEAFFFSDKLKLPKSSEIVAIDRALDSVKRRRSRELNLIYGV